ncbi:hypothetical protein [Gulosibacter sp. 10]|uniref:hypothetical protein n=1 Tax=Gulosibacter sp. 10 TaxID=1255570 RepID=UPI00097E9B68|nr:hypothetical protein [Gulosibacter sp. 10]SJM68088.1 hypothetical protein FM112_13130 [Gulosibacter sp. 10]
MKDARTPLAPAEETGRWPVASICCAILSLVSMLLEVLTWVVPYGAFAEILIGYVWFFGRAASAIAAIVALILYLASPRGSIRRTSTGHAAIVTAVYPVALLLLLAVLAVRGII